MSLIEFLNMFYSLGTDIDRIVLWQNGKCLGDQAVGDTRYIRLEHREAKVKNFSFPKRTHALYVILENKE
jgi:hypothetical protein